MPGPDIVITCDYGKCPMATIKAASPMGIKTLTEIKGSRCSGIIIKANRLKNAKKTLLDMGCVVHQVS
jgi:hypothetical protein